MVETCQSLQLNFLGGDAFVKTVPRVQSGFQICIPSVFNMLFSLSSSAALPSLGATTNVSLLPVHGRSFPSLPDRLQRSCRRLLWLLSGSCRLCILLCTLSRGAQYSQHTLVGLPFLCVPCHIPTPL